MFDEINSLVADRNEDGAGFVDVDEVVVEGELRVGANQGTPSKFEEEGNRTKLSKAGKDVIPNVDLLI